MASKYGGYAGEILDVDLSEGTIGRYEISDRDRELFIGGKGIAAKILWEELEPGIDPLSEQNIMVVMTGPLTGSGGPCTSRFNVSCKSVLTGGIASSNSGGDMGRWLKKAGYDGIVIRGRSDKPVHLEITDDSVKIRDAAHLWGLDTEQTQNALPERVGKMVIGPAGENLVRYASIICGDRAFGRTGVGAVMGSKNLKAITAIGSGNVPVFNPAGFEKAVKSWIKMLRSHTVTGKNQAAYGTAGLINVANQTNTLPHRNFQSGHWEFAEDISGETLARDFMVKNGQCTSCPIRCARISKAYGKHVVKGPEFETIGMFGPNIENRDMQKIIDWNYEMDLLGLDTITAGSTIAAAMELTEKGLLKSNLKFGETKNISKTLNDIAFRRGLGDDLAEGSMRLAIKYKSPETAMQVKGLEFAAYEPRGAVGHGLGYAVSNRGGCHLGGGYLVYFEALGPLTIDPLTPNGKAGLVVFQQNVFDAISASGNCLFTTYAILPDLNQNIIPPSGKIAGLISKALTGSGGLTGKLGKLPEWALPVQLPLLPHSKAVSELTGIKYDLGRYHAAGERIYTLERMINLREGMTAADDSLPPRMTDEPQRPEAPNSVVPLKRLKADYYGARDWTTAGIPSRELLKKLKLEFVEPAAADLRDSADRYSGMRKKLFAGEKKTADALLKESKKSAKLTKKKRVEIAAREHLSRQYDHAYAVRGSNYNINSVKCTGCRLCIEPCPVEAISLQRGVAFIDPAGCISCGKCRSVCPPNFGAVRQIPAPNQGAERAQTAYRVNYDKCKFCGLCARKCPVGAIAFEKKKLAVIEEKLCVRCGKCLAVCPPKFKAIDLVKLTAKNKTAPAPPTELAPSTLPPAAVFDGSNIG